MRWPLWLWLVWLWLPAFGSCTWDGSVSSGPFSCPDGRCPAGQDCRDGLCVAASSGDAAVADSCSGQTLFADEFDGELDQGRWEVVADQGAVAHAVDEQLEIGYELEGATAEVSMIERAALDGAEVTVEVDSPPDLSSSFIRLRLFDDSRELAPVVFVANTFDLVASIDSDQDPGQVLREEPYEPQTHRFWRIAWAADEICFSTSSDGDTFEEFACGSAEGVRSNLRAGLGAGNYAGGPQTVSFDHFVWCGP